MKITDCASDRELHPSLEEQLKEFRKYLVESTNEMAPLKVWQLQGNGNSELTVSIFCVIKNCRTCSRDIAPMIKCLSSMHRALG